MCEQSDKRHLDKLLDDVEQKLWGLYLEFNCLTKLIFNSRQDERYTMENIELSGLDHLMGRLTGDVNHLYNEVLDREIP